MVLVAVPMALRPGVEALPGEHVNHAALTGAAAILATLGFLPGGLGAAAGWACRRVVLAVLDAPRWPREVRLVSWLPAPGRRAWTLDLMRRRPDSIPGVVEALLVRSIEEAGRRGVAELSQGLAPLSLEGEGPDVGAALRSAYHHLQRFRGGRSLRQFKAKFDPRWESRYLAVEDAALLPEAPVALLRVHVPALSPRSRLRLPGVHLGPLPRAGPGGVLVGEARAPRWRRPPDPGPGCG